MYQIQDEEPYNGRLIPEPFKVVSQTHDDTPRVVARGPLEIAYEPLADIVTVEGMKYSGDFFRGMAYVLQAGMLFEFVKRGRDGVIELRHVILERPR